MAAATANGQHVGRPRNDKRLQKLRKLKGEGKPVIQIGDVMGNARQAVYSSLARTSGVA